MDLLIEQAGRLHPVEFKKTARPGRSAVAGFRALPRLGVEIGEGAVVCLRETDALLSEDVTAIPAGWL